MLELQSAIDLYQRKEKKAMVIYQQKKTGKVMKVVSFHIPEEDMEKLKEKAISEYHSTTSYLRKLIREDIK